MPLTIFIHFRFHGYLFDYYLHPNFQKAIHFNLPNLLTMSFHERLNKNPKVILNYLVIILGCNLNCIIIH